jgi:hypothetical protein
MYNLLKFMLFPYFGLGMFMAVACSSRSAWHPGLSGFAVLGIIHIVLIVIAFFMAANAKKTGVNFSRSGLAIGFALAYVAGFVIILFCMRT